MGSTPGLAPPQRLNPKGKWVLFDMYTVYHMKRVNKYCRYSHEWKIRSKISQGVFLWSKGGPGSGRAP